MKTIYSIFLYCALLPLLISCQKELSFETSQNGGSNNNNNADVLKGNWKFLNLSVKVEGVTAFELDSDSFKSVATYETVTKDNGGLLAIDATKMNLTDLTYSFDTEVKVISYANGIFVSDDSFPLSFPVSPYDASSKYQLIGTDSLYFPEGSFIGVPDGSGQTPQVSPPVGAKFSITGTKLAIIVNQMQNVSSTQNGVDYTLSQNVNGIINFEKQ